MAKKILFVCATGVATSTEVAERVTSFLKANGIDCDYEQTNVASVQDDPWRRPGYCNNPRSPMNSMCPPCAGFP